MLPINYDYDYDYDYYDYDYYIFGYSMTIKTVPLSKLQAMKLPTEKSCMRPRWTMKNKILLEEIFKNKIIYKTK